MKAQPLRYSISSWYDLPKCLSNNSKELKIFVEDILDDDSLVGTLISIYHKKYGALFSHLVDSYGEIVTPTPHGRPHEFKYTEILEELAKFGFVVEFTPQLHLSDSMKSYLKTLQHLNYDKLRIITIKSSSKYIIDNLETINYVVAFSPDKLPKWLDNMYDPSKSEFSDALMAGDACNVSMSPEGKHLDWSWLDYIASISDLIDNDLSE